MQTSHRICSICEAACGLQLDHDGRNVVAIRANNEDVFSTGHVCAKGIALSELHADPDRLRTPLIRDGDTLREASWVEAWEFIATRLTQITTTYGPNAVASYAGNPTAHNVGLSRGFGVFAGTLGSKNVFSAGTVDQVPKQLACELMFGNDMAIPVPDILRCDYLLMLGANPVVSNGSLWVVPKIREKIRDLQARDGKLVVVDPRRTETARIANQHLAIQPGGDAWLLAAIFNALVERGHKPPANLPTKGFIELTTKLATITPTQVEQHSALTQPQIDGLVKDLLTAKNPVVYGRVGTTLQVFGTLTSFLVDAINVMLNAFDTAGGAMFPDQPMYEPSTMHAGIKHNRYQSRVSAVPEVLGQMPVTVMAEEMLTEGEEKIRAMVCFAGNPVVSNPDSTKVTKALKGLDLLVCIDLYHNETTELADVVLPGTSPFEDSHYDNFLGSMGYKNTARYSPPVFPLEHIDEWNMGLTLAYTAAEGRAPSDVERSAFEDNVIAGAVTAQVQDENSGIYQRDVQEIMAAIEPRSGVERLLDLGVRAGRWGDHFGTQEGLTLQQMADTPNGIELGSLEAGRLPQIIRHADGLLDLAPALILAEIGRLAAHPIEPGLKLIGRRSTRSNNTWLRNLPALGKGKDLCNLQMHPEDAKDRALEDGVSVIVTSPTGTVQATLEITDTLAKGVACLPHGFTQASTLRQSNLLQGPNYNELAATHQVDVPSGTAALNGIRVEVGPITMEPH